jgi:hypothetical protein
MKTVNEVLGKIKGSDKITETLTGKASFSKTGFEDVVSALANDTTFKIPVYNKNTGKQEGDINVSELLRADMKKTLEKAKYPQKSEASVLDTCEISVKGLAEAIPYIVNEQIRTGKKFDLPQGEKYQGSVYLADVKGKVRDVNIRDPKTQENLGTCTITTKDSVQVKTKSGVPKYLSDKVRKDKSGNVIK